MKSASTNEKSTCGKQKFFYLKLSDNTQYDAEIREKYKIVLIYHTTVSVDIERKAARK